jgi:hypothetical protein
MGGGRLEPIDKKQLGQELLIPAGAEGEGRRRAGRSEFNTASKRLVVWQVPA